MKKTAVETPPDGSQLLFAGTADIDEENMHALLDNLLPEGVSVGIGIQQMSPRRAEPAGLGKVLRYFKEIFGEPDDNDDDPGYYRVRDMLGHINNLGPQDNPYLIVLWGEGGDRQTEELVDAAMRRDIPVWDLTAGLDTLELKPEPPALIPAARKRRAVPAPGSEKTADDPPWDESTEKTPDKSADIAALLAIAFDGAAQALRDAAQHNLVPAGSLPGQPPPVTAMHPEDSRQASAPEARPQRKTSAALPPGTRAWLKNPELPDDDPDAYEPKPARGLPRAQLRSWEKVYLTPEQEKELGLG